MPNFRTFRQLFFNCPLEYKMAQGKMPIKTICSHSLKKINSIPLPDCHIELIGCSCENESKKSLVAFFALFVCMMIVLVPGEIKKRFCRGETHMSKVGPIPTGPRIRAA